jgi:seryl-tRNA synthetase
MIDLEFLRSSPAQAIALLAQKDPHFDTAKLIALDQRVRAVRAQTEHLRKQKNEYAKQGATQLTAELREQSQQISKQLAQEEQTLESIEKEFKLLYLSCPNIPEADLPHGGKEANKVVKVVGEKPTFTFPVKNHLELGTALGWLDFEVATKIAGSNFAFYKKDSAALVYALAMMMLKNNVEHGYEVVVPPALVNEKSLEVASNFPKFREQVYAVPADQLYLTPTAEVDLANIYRDEIVPATQLPIRMTSWTSCFRREAGTYGSAERGLIRIHQFEKVELFVLCEPQNANDELDRMVACAEAILKKLDLHYRISLLAMQDCSFASARTFDIEVWLPGQKEYYEVSSCSNCTDFQARRGKIRYKHAHDKHTTLVYTLNGSSLALPRLMVALMETYQQQDGSIALPDVLKPYWLL